MNIFPQIVPSANQQPEFIAVKDMTKSGADVKLIKKRHSKNKRWFGN